MALTLTPAATPIAETIVRLDPAIWGQKVKDLAEAMEIKKNADAAARKADKVISVAKAEIARAMGSAPSAICGNAVITPKTTASADATVTLTTGETILWETVTGLTVGNKYIAGTDVKAIYGGRSGSFGLTISGSV